MHWYNKPNVKLFYIDQGQGNAIVFIHGMALSSKYWSTYVNELSKTHRTVAVDLLGFGESPISKEGYGEQQHINALHETLASLDLQKPYTLVGHSLGSLLALKYTNAFPDEVNKLVLIAMPLYTSTEEARADITKGRWLLKQAYYGSTSQVLCTIWCKMLRPLSSRLAPRYLKNLPKEIAADTVRHTWHAYADSMKAIIEDQNVQEELAKLKAKTVMLFGTKDSKTVLKNVEALKETLPPNVELVVTEGTHNLALENPDLVQQYIAD